MRQIPHFFTEQRLAKLLKNLLVYDGTTDQIRTRSLASSVDSHQRPPTKVATICFDGKRPTALSEGKDEWVFDKETYHLEEDVVVDTHFLGFTVLNDVKEDEYEIEYVLLLYS